MDLFFCQSVADCEDETRRSKEDEGDEEDKKQEEDARSSGSDEGFMSLTPLLQAHHAMERMEEFVHKVFLQTRYLKPPKQLHKSSFINPAGSYIETCGSQSQLLSPKVRRRASLLQS